MLNATTDTLSKCWRWLVSRFDAYCYHRRAIAAAVALNRHSRNELKDIGIIGGHQDIERMAHFKCPWCHKTI